LADCWLTVGRKTLLAALQADATLDAGIREWFTWGPGIRKRFKLEPSVCPLLSLVPAELREDDLSNITDQFPQDVEIGIATDGQDAGPCEALVAAAVGVVNEENRSALGLSGEGLASVRVISVRWAAQVDEKDPRVRWLAEIVVRLMWFRTF